NASPLHPDWPLFPLGVELWPNDSRSLMKKTSKPTPPSPQDSLLVFYWRAIVRPRKRIAAFIVALISLGGILQVATLGLAVPLLQTLMSADSAVEPNRSVAVFRTV